jgi:alpha,alpha-trehalase
MPEGNVHDLGYHTLAVCESGWDICSRWGFEVYNYNPVDLNSLMYLFEKNMQYFSLELGTDEDDIWANAAEKRKSLMLEYMDNGEGLLLDYNFESNTRSEVFSAASFYPMFVGLLDNCRAEKLVENLNRLEAKYGVLTTENNNIKGSYQWGYPNGWACLQYITVFALQKYGFVDDARRIAQKYIELVDKIFDETENLWEKYNVIDGSIEVVDEYKMPTMMGWSAGVYLAATEFLENGNVV